MYSKRRQLISVAEALRRLRPSRNLQHLGGAPPERAAFSEADAEGPRFPIGRRPGGATHRSDEPR